MSKKPFEHIEDKIKEAAESLQPAYQENAWKKMNALLDKETDNRRPVPFWLITALLVLLAGGGYWYFSSSTSKNKNTLAAIEEKQPDKSAVAIKEPPHSKEKPGGLPEKSSTANPVVATTTGEAKSNNQTVRLSRQQQKKDLTAADPHAKEIFTKGNSASNKFSSNGKLKMQVAGGMASNSDDAASENKPVTTDALTAREETIVTGIKEKTAGQPLNNIVTPTSEQVVKNETASSQKTPEEKPVAATGTKPASQRAHKKIISRLYLLGSLGAEAASVKFLSFNRSKFAATYGIGIGYQLSKKISIQTGFYSGLKKYTAGHNDYHPKAGSYWSQVYIKKVDATCTVYEIPLSIRYTFSQKRSANYFVTAGLSSYIMKKEDYNYDYMHYDTPYTGRYIYTGNKKLFSVFTFSAGIDKRLSENLSWFAGPSFSIPIAGVGEGSVKLFSAGIQAGIRFQPSSKK